MLKDSSLSQQGNYDMTITLHHRDGAKLVKFAEAMKGWLLEDDGNLCLMSVKFQPPQHPFWSLSSPSMSFLPGNICKILLIKKSN